jgi:ribosome-associated protein
LILESLEIAHKAVEAASDKQAENIVLLDTRKVCYFADYFVILTATSDRQTEAIREAIEKSLKTVDVFSSHSEGASDSGWILVDFGGVVIHIFSSEKRDYYKLDELWSAATPVVRIQ